MKHYQEKKRNIETFNRDAAENRGYVYTRIDKLSTKFSNERTTRAIAASTEFRGKDVLDLGCGDGTFTLELARFGAQSILGIDPSPEAINLARERAEKEGLSHVSFMVGDIYNLEETRMFHIVVLRGVLHHLPDPFRALTIATALGKEVVVLEPNGNNPILKIIERISRYHVDHEEQSFLPLTIEKWCKRAGLTLAHREFINLVPIFCPDLLAEVLKGIEPIVERAPILRNIACGQYILRAISTRESI